MRHSFSVAVVVLSCVISGFANGQERDQPRDRQEVNRDVHFQPQNDRERVLWNMIQQLRSEVAQLRQQIGNRDRPAGAGETPSRNASDRVRREGDMPQQGDRASGHRVSSDPLLKQASRIFTAYDRNRDQRVSFDEWLAMREGEMTSERRSREMAFFSQQAGDDQLITLEEFYRAMVARTRGTAPREDSARDRGPRDSDTRDRGPRDSDTRDRVHATVTLATGVHATVTLATRGPRDSDTRDRGPRDSDTRDRGPRDSDTRDRGPRDSDTRDRGPRDSDTRDRPRERE